MVPDRRVGAFGFYCVLNTVMLDILYKSVTKVATLLYYNTSHD